MAMLVKFGECWFDLVIYVFYLHFFPLACAVVHMVETSVLGRYIITLPFVLFLHSPLFQVTLYV